MSPCRIQESGTIELYFYEELGATEQATVREHLARCRDCAQALEELRVIRAVLAARPDVSSPASGDWSGFMARLDSAVQTRVPARVVPFARPSAAPRRAPVAGLLAMAALLAIVSITVFMAAQAGRTAIVPGAGPAPARTAAAESPDPAPDNDAMEAALTAVGLSHLERSKLVVLGLATKEPSGGAASDWAYERELASSLLNDTRIYRQAAERRGLDRLAGVMRDLELVLLQTAMAEGTDTAALPQIQRLIQKRGLVEKMDVVGTTGLVP